MDVWAWAEMYRPLTETEEKGAIRISRALAPKARPSLRSSMTSAPTSSGPPAQPCGRMVDPRGRLLLTALDFAGLRREVGGSAVEIQSLRRWLDSWPGVGAIERGMAHQGYDLQLTRYDEQVCASSRRSRRPGHARMSDEVLAKPGK